MQGGFLTTARLAQTGEHLHDQQATTSCSQRTTAAQHPSHDTAQRTADSGDRQVSGTSVEPVM